MYMCVFVCGYAHACMPEFVAYICTHKHTHTHIHTHKVCCFLSGEGVLDFEILQVLPFDSSRKCMSVILRHPVTREKILYCKGADSTILPQLAPTG